MHDESHNQLRGASICVVGINYAPDTTGIAPYTAAMAAAFRDAGADVHVVTGVPHYPEWRMKEAKYREGARWSETIDGIRVTRVAHVIPSRTNLLGRARMEASFFFRAAIEVRRDMSDMVITVTPSLAGLAAGLAGKKARALGVVVQDLTGNGAAESGTTGRAVSTAISRTEYAMVRRAQQVSVITKYFADELHAHGVMPERIHQIPNFAHIKPVTDGKLEARQKLGWPEQKTLVVHTGNMGMKQGLEHLVSVARIAQDTRAHMAFILVGDGNQKHSLQKLAAELESVHFMDPLDDKQYPLALAAADILLVHERPGVKQMSLPSKITSYTSAGRPIIAAVEPGGITHETLNSHGGAVCVPTGKPFELLEAIDRIVGDHELSRELADQALRAYRERYSRASALKKYVNFANKLWGDR